MHKYLPLLLYIGLGFFSCEKSPIIESKKAINLLDNNEYYFLDVRTEIEHDNKSIPNTECIPVQEIEKRIGELKTFKDKKIIVYCRSGNRSKVATKILNKNGFNAYNLNGGMNEWEGKVEAGK
tara:strand:- start:557 stop:925 length:369 start_codon:yes stop_codon:yes gene_type:complete